MLLLKFQVFFVFMFDGLTLLRQMSKKDYRAVEFSETGDSNVISTLPLLVIFVFSAPCFLLWFFGIN